MGQELAAVGRVGQECHNLLLCKCLFQALGWEGGSESRLFPPLEMPGDGLEQYSHSECISGFPNL